MRRLEILDKDIISIHKFIDNDLKILENWLEKEYIQKWYGDPQEWLDEIENVSGEFDWINHYIVKYNDRPIGFCQYYDCSKTPKGYEWDNEPIGTFAIDYLIGDEGYLGKGLSKIIVQKLENLIISIENPIQIIADPVKENVISIGLLVKSGYFYDAETGLYKKKI